MSGRGGTPTAKPSVATPAGPTTQSSIGTNVDNIKAAVNQGIRGAITAGTWIFAATGGAEAVNQLGNLNKKNAVNADLVFPSDLLGKTPEGYNYYMAFKFSDYKKPDIYSPPTPIFKDGIKLPIPTRLSVDTAVHYQEASLGSAMGAAAQQIKNLQMDKIIDNPTNIASVLKDSGVNVVSAGAAGAVLDTLKSAVPQQISQGLSYATGIAINPFLSVLFDSPTFRTYNFSWKFMPRSQYESQTLTEIIRIFNKNTLPSLSSGFGLYYNYPSIVDISIVTPDNSNNLFQFKQAVVEKISVNYAAANSPVFFRGSSAPAAVEINVNIKEIVLWKSEDYDDETTKLTKLITTQVKENNQTGPVGEG